MSESEKDLRISALEAEVEHLKEEVRWYKLQMYGQSSEKKIDKDVLFNEAEVLADAPEVPFKDEKKSQEYNGRVKNLNPAIPRKEIKIELPKEEKCACSLNSTYEKIGEEVRERLNIIPAKFEVNRYIEMTYKCSCCGQIKKAHAPSNIIPKGDVDNGLLTELIISKYENHAPLYRAEEIFHRLGVALSRNTTSRWVIKVAEAFEPLINLMKEDIRTSDYVQCDETPVQVLREPGKAPTTKSYMWVLRNARQDKPMTLFTYEPSRSGATALNLLDGIKGAIQTDGYKGYNGLEKDVEHLACWAHVRRKFFEAVKATYDEEEKKKNKKKKRVREKMLCEKGLQFVTLLYQVDHLIKNHKFSSRKARMSRILEEFYKWLINKKDLIPPKSLTGKAIGYTLTIWTKLEKTALNESYLLDNNLCENAIRPFALGRRNWLFACSQKGANASGNIYSLIESAKANGLNTRDYISDLIGQIPQCQTVEDFEKLLPYNWKPKT